jgi:hypothetical protein
MYVCMFERYVCMVSMYGMYVWYGRYGMVWYGILYLFMVIIMYIFMFCIYGWYVCMVCM